MGCASSKNVSDSDKKDNVVTNEQVTNTSQENNKDNSVKAVSDQQNSKKEEIKNNAIQETPKQVVQNPPPPADKEKNKEASGSDKKEVKKEDLNKRKHTHNHDRKNSTDKVKSKDSKSHKSSEEIRDHHKKSIKDDKKAHSPTKKDERHHHSPHRKNTKTHSPGRKEERRKSEEKPKIDEENKLKKEEEEENKLKEEEEEERLQENNNKDENNNKPKEEMKLPKINTDEINSQVNAIPTGRPPLSNRNLPHPIPPVIPTPSSRRKSLEMVNENSLFPTSSSEPIPHFNSTGSNGGGISTGTGGATGGGGYVIRGQMKKGISPSQMKKVVHRPESMNLDQNEIQQNVLSLSNRSADSRSSSSHIAATAGTPPRSPVKNVNNQKSYTFNNNNNNENNNNNVDPALSPTNLNPDVKHVLLSDSTSSHHTKPPLAPSEVPYNDIGLPEIPSQSLLDNNNNDNNNGDNNGLTPSRRGFRRTIDSMKFAESLVTPAKPEETVKIKQQQVYAHFTSYYTLGKLIGGGNFGKVYKGFRNVDCLNVAVKVIPIQAGFNMTMIQREVDITTSLSHPNLEKCYGVFADQKYLYIVNELIDGGELLTEINRVKIFPIDRVKVIFITLGKAILYCHKQKVIHRDIKPENILYGISNDDTTLKLIDFGFAKEMNGQKTQAICGTPEYIAPEVISNKPYDEKADIWSLGVIAFLLITGRLPFPNVHGNTNVMFNYIKSGAYEFKEQIWENNPQAKYFVQKCLQVDPSHRFDALELMQSPFLTSHIDYLDLTKYEEYLPKCNRIRHGSQFGSALVPDDVETLYEFQEIIGFGTIGCVYRAQLYTANYNGDYDVKAIKVIKRDLIQNNYQKFLKDLSEQLRGYFNSDNINKVYQIQETVDYLYIVEDFLPYENSLIACLSQRTTYTQYDVVCIICYIISTLISTDATSDYVYVHKNIKPDNIFLINPEDLRSIMLSDYNISQDYFLSPNKYRNIKYESGYASDEEDHFQSLDFLPPEYFDHKRLSSPCDIWAIGVLTYFLISGYLPFSTGKSTYDTIHSMFAGINDEYFRNDFWQSIAPECKDFIKHCLYVNPNSRMSIQEASNHPFLTSTLVDVNLDSIIPLFKQYQGDRDMMRSYHNQFKQENYFTFITN